VKNTIFGCVLAFTLVPALAGDGGAAGLRVYRTMMPDSGPSSFAVGLGADFGLSYDPGRGGVNYIWRGEFADLGPTVRAKINNPAEIRGAIVYRESIRYPLRLNDREREPKFEFKGYSLLGDAVEFRYLLDGVLVREEIRASPDGRGVARRFRLSGPLERWWYLVEPQPGVEVSSAEGFWNEQRTSLSGSGGREFTIVVSYKGEEK
jgi:hypothetical protein